MNAFFYCLLRIPLLIVFVLLLTPPVLNAMPNLKWTTVVSTAASQNRDIRQANVQIESASEAIRLARREYGPKLSAAISTAQSLDGTGGLNFSQSLTLTQSKTGLFDGEIDVSAAMINEAKTIADASATIVSIRRDLANAYIDLWYAAQLVRLNQQILDRRTKNFELIHAGFEAGREHLGSEQWAKAQVGRASVDLVQSKRQVALAKLTLGALMGRVSVPEDAPDHLEPNTFDTTGLTDNSVPTGHPNLISARAQIEAAKIAIGQAKTTSLPALSAGLTANQSNPLFRDGSGSSGLSASVAVSVPLFTNQIDSSRVRQAELALQQAIDKKESVEFNLNVSVKSAVIQVQNARDDLSAQRQFRDAAVTRSEIAEAQYRSGLLSYENWDVIENEVINQQRQLLARERDLYKSITTWQNAIGKGL